MDADEQGPPVLVESSTEFYRVLNHVLIRLLASRRLDPLDAPVMVGIRLDGVWYIDGEPVVDDDGAYRDGGFGAVPASEEAIAALPGTTVGDGQAREKQADDCAVCLEDYQAGDTLRTMPCSHGFHESCILSWLRVSRLCPLCRFALPAAQTESLMSEEDDDDDT